MLRNLFLLLTAIPAIGCARVPATTTTLTGGTWRLASVGQAMALPSDESRRPWLRFEADSGRVSGHLGCNRMAGPFTSQGDELRFGALISTRMACADDAMNRQEAALAGALQSTDHYRIRGDTLDLLRGTGSVALFARVP